MAPIYNIIQSVPFWSVFPTLFTRHHGQYSDSIPSAGTVGLGQRQYHAYKMILMQTPHRTRTTVELI